MSGAANADLAAGVEQQKRVAGMQRDITSAGHDRRPRVSFHFSVARSLYDEVVAFDPADNDGQILRGEAGKSDGRRCQNCQACEREPLEPGFEPVSWADR